MVSVYSTLITTSLTLLRKQQYLISFNTGCISNIVNSHSLLHLLLQLLLLLLLILLLLLLLQLPPFYTHYTGQPALAGTMVNNCWISMEQSYTAHKLLLMATSAFVILYYAEDAERLYGVTCTTSVLSHGLIHRNHN